MTKQALLLDPISVSAVIPCKITYLPNRRCKKPRTIVGSHKVWGLVKNLSEAQFPVAFKVTKYDTVCKEARTHEDLSSRELPTQSGYFTTPVRTYDGKFYRPYQFGFGAVRTTRGVNTTVALELETKWHFNRDIPDMTPPETGMFFTEPNKNIHVSDNQEKTTEDFKDFMSQFVSFRGKLWVECGEPYYHFVTFGMNGDGGSVGFFVDYEKEWLTWHEGDLVYNAKHRKKCLQEARNIAIRRGNDLTLLTGKYPKENIEILMPKMVKIKENIF